MLKVQKLTLLAIAFWSTVVITSEANAAIPVTDLAITCDQAVARVERDRGYLWALKGNTEKVTAEQYKKAYKNYASTIRLYESTCSRDQQLKKPYLLQ